MGIFFRSKLGIVLGEGMWGYVGVNALGGLWDSVHVVHGNGGSMHS